MHEGDDGSTRLADGSCVRKDEPRVWAIGSVDELNAQIGLAAAACSDAALGNDLRQIQCDLVQVGAALASRVPPPHKPIADEHVRRLEQWIDRAHEVLPPIGQFVLPGGSELGARLHVARTTCRRAERVVVGLDKLEPVPAEVLRYLNRLGDLLFAWARLANQMFGAGDTFVRGC
jgi:cob(I)alamin adenosyltransferase